MRRRAKNEGEGDALHRLELLEVQRNVVLGQETHEGEINHGQRQDSDEENVVVHSDERVESVVERDPSSRLGFVADHQLSSN